MTDDAPRSPADRFRLHPEARSNFDQKASALASEIEALPATAPPAGQGAAGWQPDLHASLSIRPEHVIGTPIVRSINPLTGAEVARVIPGGPEIEGDLHARFTAIVDGLFRAGTVAESVSRECLAELLAEWIGAARGIEPPGSMCSRVLEQAALRVKRVAVWVPIFDLYLEDEIQMGQAVLRTLSRDLLDTWEARVLEPQTEGTRKIVEEAFTRDFRRLQGHAAAHVELDAEPERAKEIAADRAELAVAMVRLYHTALLSPQVRCRTAVRGLEHETTIHQILDDGGGGPRYSRTSTHTSHRRFELTRAEIHGTLREPLGALHELLLDSKRKGLRASLFDALYTYSQAALRHEVSDRLMYILVAVESLLVRDNMESIQQNVADRMAIFLGKSVEERKGIVRTVKVAYDQRSRFVHHGQPIEKIEAVQGFMMHAWLFFNQVLQNRDRFQDVAALIQAIDDAKYR